MPRRRLHRCALLAGLSGILAAAAGHADTVASLLGNFTINQFEALSVSEHRVEVHYVVVYGQLPALRELHLADANGDGITSDVERDAYVGGLAPGLADGLTLTVDGTRVPLRATRWHSSLPTEQGGFSLRIDMDFSAALPAGTAAHAVQFDNQNFPGRIGWHEIVVTGAAGVAVFDTDAFATSATNALTDALQALPADGPLDERSVHFRMAGQLPAGAAAIGARPGTSLPNVAPRGAADYESTWITARTRALVDAISAPQLAPGVMLGTLLAALLLGAVHALSPGHGKTIVGAYLIGSRGTPRHAAFLGFTVTVTHTLGVFAVGFATLYASRFIVPERLFPILSLISAIMVLGMGVVLLVQRARAARGSPAAHPAGASAVFSAMPIPRGRPGPLYTPLLAHHQGDGTLHSHGGGPLHSHLPPGARGERVTWRSLLTLGISGGLVPCPSAMVLLLAAIALNKTAYGMLLVLVFSVGLAITLTLVGLAFLYARNRFGGGDGDRWWTRWLPVVSASMITLVGGALCVAAARSFT